MIRVCRLGLSTLVVLVSALTLRAQTTVPATTQAIPPVSLTSAVSTQSLDLKNYFNVPGVTGTVVQLDTVVGKFNMEMYASDAPLTVANFLSYVNSGAYNGTIIHRSVPGFVIQGGGYKANSSLDSIARQAPIPLEYKLPNVIGSLSMARTSVADSATSEWFVNVADNTTTLGKNGSSPEGYAVFARVIGTGMSVVNTIVNLPRTNLGDTSPFATLPLYNYTTGSSASVNNLVAVNTAAGIPIYPGSSGASVITFAATSSAPAVATVSVSGSTLTVTPVSSGTATLTVTATDTNGSVATATAQVTVNITVVPAAPVITTQPVAQTVTSGTAVTFSVVATGTPTPTYQWKRGGVALSGATSSTFVISNATTADAGDYTVDVKNSVTTVTSAAATLTVTDVATAPAITTQPVAQTVANGSTVVFRVVATGAPAPTYQWTRNGAAIVGATSATLVISNATAANTGDYAVTVKNSINTVTSTAASLTINTPKESEVGRLINLSILTTAGTGSKILTMGAAISRPDGSTDSLPLSIRGVGPSLKDFFGITTALADPTLAIYSQTNSSTPIATNDNWGTNSAAGIALIKSVGFTMTEGSLDSAYAALPPGFGPGAFTVQVAGKGTASGTVIAEIYDAIGSARTDTTPRLVNLSTRAQIDPSGNLRVGFVLNGLSARTVLVRAVGPSLSVFGIDGVMADPKLELFDNDHGGAKLGENDNWGGDAQLAAVAKSVGAFDLAGPATKDAVLLVTLPAGAYSALLSGVGNAGGVALVEVYEVR